VRECPLTVWLSALSRTDQEDGTSQGLRGLATVLVFLVFLTAGMAIVGIWLLTFEGDLPGFGFFLLVMSTIPALIVLVEAIRRRRGVH
jgi:hypothetical protein